jgi:hypothetical protein
MCSVKLPQQQAVLPQICCAFLAFRNPSIAGGCCTGSGRAAASVFDAWVSSVAPESVPAPRGFSAVSPDLPCRTFRSGCVAASSFSRCWQWGSHPGLSLVIRLGRKSSQPVTLFTVILKESTWFRHGPSASAISVIQLLPSQAGYSGHPLLHVSP